jgi:hypothetical protein
MKKVLLIPFILALVCSCGREQPAVNPEQSVITGIILGSGGRPPALARIDVVEPDSSGIPKRFQAKPDGSFEAVTSKTGAVRLTFAGAHHDPFSVALLLRAPTHVKLEVRIAPCEWVAPIGEIRVIGDFNEFSQDEGCVFMVKQPDGTYAAELANIGGEKFGYQLIGLAKGTPRPIPGVRFDDMIMNAAGDFVSRLTVHNGTVRIVFDPAGLPRSPLAAGVNFVEAGGDIAAVAALEAEMRDRQEQYSRAAVRYRAFGSPGGIFQYDWSKSVADLKRRLAGEKNPVLRQMLFISMLDLRRQQAQEVEDEVAKQALAEIPPDSPLWELTARSLLYDSIRMAGGLGANRAYFDAVVNRHNSREVRALTLEQAFLEAMSSGNLDPAREYYRRLTTEFSDLRPGRRVQSRPPPAIK